MELFQIAAMAFCGIALVSLVKAYKPEISLYVSLAVGLILLLLILAQLQDVFVFFEEFDESFSYGSSKKHSTVIETKRSALIMDAFIFEYNGFKIVL